MTATHKFNYSRWLNFEHARAAHVAKYNEEILFNIETMQAEHDAAIEAGDTAKAGRIDQAISRAQSTLLKS